MFFYLLDVSNKYGILSIHRVYTRHWDLNNFFGSGSDPASSSIPDLKTIKLGFQTALSITLLEIIF